jgi:hypothetical protein
LTCWRQRGGCHLGVGLDGLVDGHGLLAQEAVLDASRRGVLSLTCDGGGIDAGRLERDVLLSLLMMTEGRGSLRSAAANGRAGGKSP